MQEEVRQDLWEKKKAQGRKRVDSPGDLKRSKIKMNMSC